VEVVVVVVVVLVQEEEERAAEDWVRAKNANALIVDIRNHTKGEFRGTRRLARNVVYD